MHEHMTGPFWGNVWIICAAGIVTLACFAAMLRMLLHPGETDRLHPKFSILPEDGNDEVLR